ncbi:MAG: hypothetical protein KDA68_09740 [Planctomycetaceae bacterium]|nr:hypothetical protein [Planctomycetaceae bacterium]
MRDAIFALIGIVVFSPSFEILADAPVGWGHLRGRIIVEGKVPAKYHFRKGDPIYERQSLLENIQGIPPEQIGIHQEDLRDNSIQVSEKNGGLKNAFVYLQKFTGEIHPALKDSAKTPVEFRRRSIYECEPRALFLQTNQKLHLYNESPEVCSLHVYSIRNSGVNKLLPAVKESSELSWPHPERQPMVVKDDIHPEAKSYWLILDHPHAAISKADGSFEIQHLPAGKQTLKLWFEKIGFIDNKLIAEIEPDKTTTLPPIKIPAEKLLDQ